MLRANLSIMDLEITFMELPPSMTSLPDFLFIGTEVLKILVCFHESLSLGGTKCISSLKDNSHQGE